MLTDDWIKNEWLENVSECIENNKAHIRVCFKVYTNFSFVDYAVQKELKNTGSVAIDDIHVKPIKIPLNNIKIKISESCLEITDLILNENKYQTGLYDAELFAKKYIDCQPQKIEFSGIISKDAQAVTDIFKYVITFLGFSIIIIPSSLHAYVKCNEKWKKVVQIGEGSMPNYPCDISKIDTITKELPDISKNILKTFSNKKLLRIQELLNTGLRFEKNKLLRESFLNYYTIIELIFREKNFRNLIISTLGKPNEVTKLLGNVNQKIMMLFLWEYITTQNNSLRISLNDFLELAEIRNTLSHTGDAKITWKNIMTLKALMFDLVRKIYELL